MARVNSAVLHWLLSLGDPEVAIGQCRSGGIMVATEAPAHGVDNVVLDKENSGGPPLPHQRYQMWASIKKKPSPDIHGLLGIQGLPGIPGLHSLHSLHRFLILLL